jgi:ribosomal protein S16
VDHWVKLGAVASDTVRTLIDRNPAPPATDEPVTAAATA